MITQLSATNFKGSTFSHKLGRFTVFWGENFEGKSSRAEALELALTGQVHGATPKTGMKAKGDIIEHLSSGAVMKVGATSETESVQREYRSTTPVTVTGTLQAPAVLFTAAEFLDMSEKERVKALFNALPPPDLSKVGPVAIVTKIKGIVCDPHTEAHQEAVMKYCTSVEESHEENEEITGLPVQEWLEQLVESMKAQANADAAEAKTMRQTVLGVTALKPEDLPALAPAEEKLRQAREAHTKARDTLVEARRQYKEVQGKINAMPEVRPEESNLFPVEAIMAEKTNLEEKVSKYVEPEPVDVATVESQILSTEKSLIRTHTVISALSCQITNFDALECCPTCHGKSKGWKKAVLENLNGDLLKAQSEGVSLERERDVLVAAMVGLNNTSRQVALIRKTHATEAKRLREVNALMEQHRNAIERTRLVQEHRAQIPALQQQLSDLAIAGQQAALTEQHTSGKVTEAETSHRALVAQHASNATAAKALEQAEKSEASAQVGKQVRELLAELLATAVELSVAPLVTLCNRLTDGILRNPVRYRDGGLMVEGRGGTTRSISGAEKALVYAGLSIALASRTGPKLLVLDEVNRIVGKNRQKLYSKVQELLMDGTLEQAVLVVADTKEPEITGDNVVMIHVEAK